MGGQSTLGKVLSIPAQLAISVAVCFLSALLARDAWNWFVAPLAPSTLSEASYPVAFGIVMAIEAFGAIAQEAKIDERPAGEFQSFQNEHPIAAAAAKAVAKAIGILLVWGVCAIAHAIIG